MNFKLMVRLVALGLAVGLLGVLIVAVTLTSLARIFHRAFEF
jgi:hypothetical protein